MSPRTSARTSPEPSAVNGAKLDGGQNFAPSADLTQTSNDGGPPTTRARTWMQNICITPYFKTVAGEREPGGHTRVVALIASCNFWEWVKLRKDLD